MENLILVGAEDGLIDVIVRPQVYSRYRGILHKACLLLVEGKVQSSGFDTGIKTTCDIIGYQGVAGGWLAWAIVALPPGSQGRAGWEGCAVKGLWDVVMALRRICNKL